MFDVSSVGCVLVRAVDVGLAQPVADALQERVARNPEPRGPRAGAQGDAVVLEGAVAREGEARAVAADERAVEAQAGIEGVPGAVQFAGPVLHGHEAAVGLQDVARARRAVRDGGGRRTLRRRERRRQRLFDAPAAREPRLQRPEVGVEALRPSAQRQRHALVGIAGQAVHGSASLRLRGRRAAGAARRAGAGASGVSGAAGASFIRSIG